MRDTPTCDDCVVTFLCEREPDEAVLLDLSELQALRRLAAAGLAPELQHTPGDRAREGVAREGDGRIGRVPCSDACTRRSRPSPPRSWPARSVRRTSPRTRRGRHRRRHPLTRARQPGGAQGRRPPRRHGVHLPQPGPLDRRRTALVRDAAAIVVGARRYAVAPPPQRGRRGPAADGGPRSCRPLRLDRPLRPAARGAAGRRPAPPGRRLTGPWCSPTTTRLVDREAAYRAGLGWFGKNANLLLPGSGHLVRARLGGHRRAAARRAPRRCADGCGACRRCLDGCPTGAIVAPGVVDARRCLAWLVQQPGTFPRRAPGGARRPHLRLRRLPGGVPAQPAACDRARPPALARRPAVPRPGSPLLDLLARRRRRAARPPRPLVHRRAGTRAGCAATRSWCWATSATRRRARSCAALRATSATPTRCCGPTPRGRPRPPRAAHDLLAALAATIADVRRRAGRARARPSGAPGHDAPARHQRLPAQARRHPVATCGSCGGGCRPTSFAVLTTPHAGADGVGRRAAVPGRAGAGAGAAAAPVMVAARIERAGRRGRRRARRRSTRRCPSACSGPSPGPARTAWCSTAPRSPCPGGCRAAGRCWPHVLRRARHGRRRRRATRRPRPSAPPDAPLAGRRRAARRRRRPLPPARRRRAPAGPTPLRPARRRRRSCSA